MTSPGRFSFEIEKGGGNDYRIDNRTSSEDLADLEFGFLF